MRISVWETGHCGDKMCNYMELLHSDAHYSTPTYLPMDLARKDALVLAHTKWPNSVLACSAWSEVQETG